MSGPQVGAWLRRLEKTITAQGSPFSTAAAPPIDTGRLDQAQEQVGAVFPDELRQWWLWHDGAVPVRGRSSVELIGVGGYWPLSLDRALAEREYWLGNRIPEAAWWPDTWLPLAKVDQVKWLNADLELSTPDHLVLTVADLYPGGPFGHRVTLTFAEVIEQWIAYLDARYAWWDADGDCWRYVLPCPPGFERTLVIP
ncbi:MAG TPA: SMI1/KNR4 family protein [Propionicimonas sp.]